MRARHLAVVALWVGMTSSAAAVDLVFNVSPTGFPPYMIYDPETHVGSGIMVDVLRVIATKLGYGVTLSPVPRNRVTQSLEDGSLDITPRAREWEADPGRFVFSNPIVDVGNAVFSPAGRALVIRRVSDLKGHSVVTRLGYSYPELDALFADKSMVRQDAPDEAAMLRMVHSGRVDAAFLDEAVGRYLLSSLGFAASDFTISRGGLPSVGYRFMFAPRWAFLIGPFNRELEKLRTSGELDKIVARSLRR